jgi:hypothetical protein
MATYYGRSHGSFHRLLACSAGCPGFEFPLRRDVLRCSMKKNADGSGQASTKYYTKIKQIKPFEICQQVFI